MIYNFCLTYTDESTQFGVCTAESEEDARVFIVATYGAIYLAHVEVCPGIEELVNDQYGGIALLTTG